MKTKIKTIKEFDSSPLYSFAGEGLGVR